MRLLTGQQPRPECHLNRSFGPRGNNQGRIFFRLGLWFTQKLNLLLKADCGGFSVVAYNNVDSVLEAEVGYQVRKNIHIYAG